MAEEINRNQIRKALKLAAPERADELLDKYDYVLGNFSSVVASGLLSNRAEQAQEQLDLITAQLLEANEVDDSLVDSFEQELDSIRVYLEELGQNWQDKEVMADSMKGVFAFFEKYQIPMDVVSYYERYMARPKAERVPMDVIEKGFKPIEVELAGYGDPLAVIPRVQEFLVGAFSAYIDGDLDKAKGYLKAVKEFLAEEKVYDHYRFELGLDGLTHEDVHQIAEFLLDNYISETEAVDFAYKLRGLDGFDKLELSHGELRELFQYAMVAYKFEGKRADALVKQRVGIEVGFSSERAKLETALALAEKSLQKDAEALVTYRRDNPEVVADAKIAGFEEQVAASSLRIVTTQRDLAACAIRRQLAFQYLDKKGIQIGSKATGEALASLMSLDGTDEFDAVSSGLGIPGSPQLVNLRLLDHKVAAARNDYEISAAFLQSFEDYAGFDTGYAAFLKEGTRTPKVDQFLRKQVTLQAENAAVELDLLRSHLEPGLDYFHGIGAKSLASIVDPVEREAASVRLFSLRDQLDEYYEQQGALYGLVPSFDLLEIEGDPFEKLGDYAGDLLKNPEDVRDYEQQTAHLGLIKAKIGKVGRFCGDDMYEHMVPGISGIIPPSPIVVSALKPEFAGLAGILEPGYADLQGQFKTADAFAVDFPYMHEDGWKPNALDGKLEQWFERGAGVFNGVADSLEGMRVPLESSVVKLKAMLSDTNNVPPELVSARRAVINQLISQFDEALAGPFSTESIAGLRETAKAFDMKRLEASPYEIMSKIVIISAAVVATMTGGWAGAVFFGAGGFAFFGGVFGAAAGMTVGTRLGMYASDAVGLSYYEDLGAIRWDPESLALDFMRNFAITAGIGAGGILLRSVLMETAAVVPTAGLRAMESSSALVRVGGRALHAGARLGKWASVRALSGIERIGRIGQAQVGNTAVQGGLRGGWEILQELGQEALAGLHPAAELISDLVFAADGIDIPLARMGVEAQAIGISVQNGLPAYNAQSPRAFIETFKQHCAMKGITGFYAIVNPDGSVEIGRQGVPRAEAGSVTVHPSTVGASAHIHVARIDGVALDTDTGDVRLEDARAAVFVVRDLRALDYPVYQEADGSLVALKGANKIELRGAKLEPNFLTNLDAKYEAATRTTNPEKVTVDELVDLLGNGRADFVVALVARFDILDLSIADVDRFATAHQRITGEPDLELYMAMLMKSPRIVTMGKTATPEQIGAILDKLIPDDAPPHVKEVKPVLEMALKTAPALLGFAILMYTGPAGAADWTVGGLVADGLKGLIGLTFEELILPFVISMIPYIPGYFILRSRLEDFGIWMRDKWSTPRNMEKYFPAERQDRYGWPAKKGAWLIKGQLLNRLMNRSGTDGTLHSAYLDARGRLHGQMVPPAPFSAGSPDPNVSIAMALLNARRTYSVVRNQIDDVAKYESTTGLTNLVRKYKEQLEDMRLSLPFDQAVELREFSQATVYSIQRLERCMQDYADAKTAFDAAEVGYKAELRRVRGLERSAKGTLSVAKRARDAAEKSLETEIKDLRTLLKEGRGDVQDRVDHRLFIKRLEHILDVLTVILIISPSSLLAIFAIMGDDEEEDPANVVTDVEKTVANKEAARRLLIDIFETGIKKNYQRYLDFKKNEQQVKANAAKTRAEDIFKKYNKLLIFYKSTPFPTLEDFIGKAGTGGSGNGAMEGIQILNSPDAHFIQPGSEIAPGIRLISN